MRELVENLKYEHFSAEVYGQYSPKMKALEEIVKELPENEKRIVMQEYKRFTELGNNENKGFEINEQGEILRDSKVQEIYQPEKVKKREENIRDTVENDIRKETEKHQQSFEEEILEKKGILKLGYQGVELDESDLNKVHDIINKTKNKSQIEQTYEKEQ